MSNDVTCKSDAAAYSPDMFTEDIDDGVLTASLVRGKKRKVYSTCSC